MNSSGWRTTSRLLFAAVMSLFLVGPIRLWQHSAAAGAAPVGGWFIQCVDCPKRLMELGERSLAVDKDGNPHLAYGGDHLYYARHGGAGWQVETVDDALGTGWAASLALDENGQPHIAYTDVDGGLHYAHRDGDGWHREMLSTLQSVGAYVAIAVDGNGFPRISYVDGGLLQYTYRNASGWFQETVDQGLAYGGYAGSSLALDDQGRPHIAYQHVGNAATSLRYARRDVAGWHLETVDQVAEGEGRLGEFASLAVDARGYPHISYSSRRYPLSEVHYAARDGHGWHRQTVVQSPSIGPHTSLALDQDGGPHLVYYDEDGSTLVYASRYGLSWQFEVIGSGERVDGSPSLALDGSGQPHVGVYVRPGVALELRYLRRDSTPSPSWRQETVDWGGATGWHTSVALDGQGYPRISYQDFAGDNLKFAYQDRSGWHIDTVDGEHISYGPTSLALDAEGQAHISYRAGGLRYAYQDAVGWHSTIVDENPRAGAYSSLALDAGGFPHVVYVSDLAASELAYAHQDGEGWHVETIAGLAGVEPSLALDSNGRPHVSFRGVREFDLAYAYRDAAGWHVETVDGEGDVGAHSSLALDQEDNPHISYGYFPEYVPGGEMRYARKDAAGWHIATVDRDVAGGGSLALDGAGMPHIAYEFGAYPIPGLRYARPLAPGLWQLETVDGGWEGGRQVDPSFVSLALDGDGRAHISYCDSRWGHLKLATWNALRKRLYLPVG